MLLLKILKKKKKKKKKKQKKTDFGYIYIYIYIYIILIPPCSALIAVLRLCLVRVKSFPENILFSGNAIFRKGKRFHVFGCHKIHFTEN